MAEYSTAQYKVPPLSFSLLLSLLVLFRLQSRDVAGDGRAAGQPAAGDDGGGGPAGGVDELGEGHSPCDGGTNDWALATGVPGETMRKAMRQTMSKRRRFHTLGFTFAHTGFHKAVRSTRGPLHKTRARTPHYTH